MSFDGQLASEHRLSSCLPLALPLHCQDKVQPYGSLAVAEFCNHCEQIQGSSMRQTRHPAKHPACAEVRKTAAEGSLGRIRVYDSAQTSLPLSPLPLAIR